MVNFNTSSERNTELFHSKEFSEVSAESDIKILENPEGRLEDSKASSVVKEKLDDLEVIPETSSGVPRDQNHLVEVNINHSSKNRFNIFSLFGSQGKKSKSSTLENKQEKKEEATGLKIHRRSFTGPNALKRDFDALKAYYQKHPEEAAAILRRGKRKIENLKQLLITHYSKERISLLGRETLNRLLLTDSAFSSYLTNLTVIKCIAALEAIDTPSMNTFSYEMKLTDVIRYGIANGPSNLAMVTPNADKYDPTYLATDKTRRANLIKLQDAFEQARESVQAPHLEESKPYVSRWEKGYNSADWGNGNLIKEFLTFSIFLVSKPIKDLKIFSGTRPDLINWAEAVPGDVTSGRGALECKAGIETFLHRALEGTGKTIKDLSKEELIRLLANSDKWLEPHIAHLALDRLHFGAMLMFGDKIQIQARDGEISAAELIIGVASLISEEGVNSENAIAAEAIFARMAIIKDFCIENLGWIEFLDAKDVPLEIRNIEQVNGSEVANHYFFMTIQLANQIRTLEDNNPTFDENGKRRFRDGNQKELYNRLILLNSAILENREFVLEKINEFKDNEMFKYMGPLKFMSMLLKTRSMNEGNEKAEAMGLTDLEKVAVYGYTSADYAIINPALRAASGLSIKDPGLKSYAEHIQNGLRKIPDVPARNPETNEPLILKRAVFTEPVAGWAKETFSKDSIFQDHAFISTTPDLINRGFVNLTITFTEDRPTYAKNIGPFSAWQGESEILLMPGCQFVVTETDVENRPNGGASVSLALVDDLSEVNE